MPPKSKISANSTSVMSPRHSSDVMLSKNRFTATDVQCPRCNKGVLNFVELAFNKGKFYGCSRFPQCKYTLREDQFRNKEYLNVQGPRFPFKPYHTPRLNHGLCRNLPLLEGSQEQETIWQHLQLGYDVIVSARAGTGKTTTIIQGMLRMPKYRDDGSPCLYIIVAYNRKFIDELLPKLPENAIVMTIHQLGWIAVQQHFGYLGDPNEDVSLEMIFDQWGIEQYDSKSDDAENNRMLRRCAESAKSIIALCKTNCIDDPTDNDIRFIASYYNIDIPEPTTHDMVHYVMQNCWKEENMRKYGVSFDDQVWLPVRLGLPVIQADCVFLDEAQDTSRGRQELVILVSAKQICCVGDPKQAIYRFAGADARSFDNLSIMLPSAVHLPLTINWRCPYKIIEMAQTLVPDIRARPDARPGSIYEINEQQFEMVVQPGDMVLCRVNAALAVYAWKAVRNGIPVVIVGKDIGDGIAKLIDRLAIKKHAHLKKDRIYESIPILIERLRKYQAAEAEKIQARLHNTQHLLEQLNDKVETIVALTDGVTSVHELLDRIKQLFQEVNTAKQDCITFSTVHKAKGLEQARVFILESQKMPHPMAESEEDKEQELNILYIAITRVLDTAEGGKLYFVGGVPEIIRDQALHLIDTLELEVHDVA